ncbi:unnamed protein product [Malus baccata var. baccata]
MLDVLQKIVCLSSMAILLAWKVFLPKSVYILRGNHESKYCNFIYGFEKELLAKYGDKGEDVYQKCFGCFKCLPLTSIIGKYVYTAHGGLFRSTTAYLKKSKGKKKRKISFNPELSITLSLGTFEELNKAQRMVLDPPSEGSNLIPGDVLWSDPSMDPGLSLNQLRGAGLLWGPDCTEEFLKKFQRKHAGAYGFVIALVVFNHRGIGSIGRWWVGFDYATEDRYRNKGAYIVLEPPTFNNPVVRSFEAITPRPQATPFYDFEDLSDSDQESDSGAMETTP